MKLTVKVFSASLSVAVLGYVGAASAHSFSGSIAASTLTNRHDVVQATCFPWPAGGANGAHNSAPVSETNGPTQRFTAHLSARSPANITIQAFPNSSGATAVGTALNTPVYATQFTPGVYAIPNNGVYFAKINRPAASTTATLYTANLECSKAAGIAAPFGGLGENFVGDLPNVAATTNYRVIVDQ